MKKVKKLIAMGMAAVMLVTGIQYSAPEVKAAETEVVEAETEETETEEVETEEAETTEAAAEETEAVEAKTEETETEEETTIETEVAEAKTTQTQESEEAYTATPITSVKFDVKVENIKTDNNSFTWKMQKDDWIDVSKAVEFNDNDGNYDFTMELNGCSGLYNFGYIDVDGSHTFDESTSMQVTINKVTINGDYEITYDELQVLWQIKDRNGLSNVYNVSNPEKKICKGTNAYLAYEATGGNNPAYVIKFYVKDESSPSGPTEGESDEKETLDPAESYVEASINSVKFDVEVNGTITDESSFAWEMLTDPWTDGCSVTVDLEKNKTKYQISKSFSSSVKGFRNLGYIKEDPNAEFKVIVKKITVNGYEFDCSRELDPKNADGIGHVWNYNGDKTNNNGKQIYICEDAYLAYDANAGEEGLIKFYVKATPITSVKFDVTVNGITEFDNAFEWNMTPVSGTALKKAITCSKDITKYDFEQTFDSNTGTAGLKNLGFITPNQNSKLQVTVDKITINEKYELKI